MIEIEKKLALTDEEITYLIRIAEFVGKKTQTDVYYDTALYFLTAQDWWLRRRNGKFELKVSKNVGPEHRIYQYEEFDDEQEILKLLNLPSNAPIEITLARHGYTPFCVASTVRTKYKIGRISIDIDQTDFEEFTYNLVEFEIMVADSSEMPQAEIELKDFFIEHHIEVKPIRGKIIEYIRRTRPHHFQALVNAQVAKERI